MSYSQHNEDEIIVSYFKDRIGTCLSIGENDGVTISNVRALIENGWSAMLIEPSITTFRKLRDLYKDSLKIECLNVAVSDFNGRSLFYESGVHLNNGDVALLSSLNEIEIKKWEPTTKFNSYEVDVWSWESVKSVSEFKTFNFISIDAEGEDLKILKQINLKEIGCEVLCIEWNSHPEILREIKDYCYDFGLRTQLLRNAENIIMSI